LAAKPSAPLGAHALANQVRLAVRDAISAYYSTTLRSDDELAPSETRNVSLRVGNDAGAEPGTLPADPKCQGVMQKTTTEAALYTQLVHFRRLLDFRGALARMPPKDRDAARMRMDKAPDVCAALDAAASELEKTLARSAYRWVNMRTLFGAAGMA
jgi:DNA polymerase alpha subunit A